MDVKHFLSYWFLLVGTLKTLPIALDGDISLLSCAKGYVVVFWNIF